MHPKRVAPVVCARALFVFFEIFACSLEDARLCLVAVLRGVYCVGVNRAGLLGATFISRRLGRGGATVALLRLGVRGRDVLLGIFDCGTTKHLLDLATCRTRTAMAGNTGACVSRVRERGGGRERESERARERERERERERVRERERKGERARARERRTESANCISSVWDLPLCHLFWSVLPNPDSCMPNLGKATTCQPNSSSPTKDSPSSQSLNSGSSVTILELFFSSGTSSGMSSTWLLQSPSSFFKQDKTWVLNLQKQKSTMHVLPCATFSWQSFFHFFGSIITGFPLRLTNKIP